MAEELQLGQNADEIIANLEFMDSLLTQGVKHLQAFGTRIESSQETLGQNFLVITGLEGLEQQLQETENRFETIKLESTKALLQLQNIFVEIYLNLAQASQILEEAQREFESEVVEFISEFEQIFTGIETSLSDMEELSRQVDDSLEDETGEVRSEFETFAQALEEFDSRVGQFTEIYGKFDALSSEIDSNKSTVESEFEELNQKLQEEDLNEIQGRIDTAQETFKQFLENSKDIITRNAEEKLGSEVTDLISAFEATCDLEIKPKLENEFYKHISDRVEGLLNELKTAKDVAQDAKTTAGIAAGDDFRQNVVLIQTAVEEMDKCLELQLHG